MSKRSYEYEERRDYKRYREDDSPAVPKLFYIFLGEVTSVQSYGAFIKIPGYKKQGLVHKSQMSQARVDDPSEMVAKGEKVHCKVINVEVDGQKIALSMKVVNQTTGSDLDPNNVQHSLDERKRQKGFRGGERPKIELGAELNTICARCGGKGHFSQDCYYVKGEKNYNLIPDLDDLQKQLSESSPKKKKKKEKKHRKEKKKKRTHSPDSSHDSEDEEKERRKKHKHHKKHHKKERKRSASTSSSD